MNLIKMIPFKFVLPAIEILHVPVCKHSYLQQPTAITINFVVESPLAKVGFMMLPRNELN